LITAASKNPSAERLCAALHAEPRHAHQRLALAALAFRALALHEQWGFARLADYVRARHGIPLARWYDWLNAGLLLANSARARSSELNFSALSLLGRRISAAEVEASLPQLERMSIAQLRAWTDAHQAPPPDSEHPTNSKHPNKSDFVKLRLRMPRSAAMYCDETLRLARALCGGDLPDDEALAAVLAEASSEFSIPERPARLPGHTRPSSSRRPNAGVTRDDATSALELLDIPMTQHRLLAIQLDRVLHQEQSRVRTLQCSAEDELLDCVNARIPAQMGYRSLERFLEEAIHLAPSTGFDMLRRARQRRRGDPLATARADGRISAVAAILLEQLRPLGVPPSSMNVWIDEASQITVRQLRRAVLWARTRSRSDQLEWAFQDYRPPTDKELRTSERPLHELLADPQLPDLRRLNAEPTETLSFHLQSEHAQLLADLAAGAAQPGAPSWWNVLGVFHQARRIWDRNVEPSTHRFAPVLERDGYQCQVPDCSAQRELQVHHLRYRSHGGSDDPDNLITLCGWHHQRGEHGDHLRVRGTVTPTRDRLYWELGRDPDGRPLLQYRGERIMS
jgi:hypothetical protein